MAVWAFARTFPARRLALDFIPSDMTWQEKGVIEGTLRVGNPTLRTITVTRIELAGPKGEPNDITLEKGPDFQKTSSETIALTWAIPSGETLDASCVIIFATTLPDTFKISFLCSSTKGVFTQKLKIRPPVSTVQHDN
jgi:hypothetical protein